MLFFEVRLGSEYVSALSNVPPASVRNLFCRPYFFLAHELGAPSSREAASCTTCAGFGDTTGVAMTEVSHPFVPTKASAHFP